MQEVLGVEAALRAKAWHDDNDKVYRASTVRAFWTDRGQLAAAAETWFSRKHGSLVNGRASLDLCREMASKLKKIIQQQQFSAVRLVSCCSRPLLRCVCSHSACRV